MFFHINLGRVELLHEQLQGDLSTGCLADGICITLARGIHFSQSLRELVGACAWVRVGSGGGRSSSRRVPTPHTFLKIFSSLQMMFPLRTTTSIYRLNESDQPIQKEQPTATDPQRSQKKDQPPQRLTQSNRPRAPKPLRLTHIDRPRAIKQQQSTHSDRHKATDTK